MIGKLIVHAATREEAIQNGICIIRVCHCGNSHEYPFQRKILLHPKFKSAEYDTRFLEQFIS